MKQLTDEETSVMVNEIVNWKKSTNNEWDYIYKHLFYIDEIQNFRDEDEKSYEYYATILVEKAKEKIKIESKINGISERYEKWFYLNKLLSPYQWNKFKEMMKDWTTERLDTVAKQSSEIVNFLSDPRKLNTTSEEATRKGLVYGNVQSGKTAHIAATIAMYASAGCKMIIVFSGITKSLRLQTQDRLRHDLGIDASGCYDLITANSDLLGSSEPGLEGRMNSNKPCIGVFKKSPAALKRLLAYCKSPNDPNFWNRKTVLVIDDESDQYSMNVKSMQDDETGQNFERSTINGLIINLLNTFERYCYVGFTATPFAPVLNEVPGKNSLYPKDFIYPLQIDSKYYGAKKLFGSALQDPEKEITTMNSIRIVEDNEINPKINDFREIPKSLQDAIKYFIVGTACKYFRGIKSHSTMLVHLDLKIDTHEKLSEVIKNYRQYVLTNYKEIIDDFKNIWDSEKNKIPFEIVQKLFSYTNQDREKYKIPEYEDLKIYINEVLNKLEVIVDNSAHPMEERLHYNTNESKVYIVIGGNTLSRGLTLEGLLVSYFYRTSTLYEIGRAHV